MSTPIELYARKGHETVEGWLLPAAIEMIMAVAQVQRRAGLRGSVCEIGVHHGRLFILLGLAAAPGEFAVAYDLFERQDENTGRSGCGSLPRLLENAQKHNCDALRIRAVTTNSMQLEPARVVGDCGLPPRLFSIDGGHSATVTAHDLSVATGAICDGGVVILDDVFNEAWPGVAEGTCQFMFSTPGLLIPFAIGGNKLLLTTTAEWAVKYIEGLRVLAPDHSLRKSAMFGSELVVITPLDSRLFATPLRRLRRRVRQTALGNHAARIRRRWLR